MCHTKSAAAGGMFGFADAAVANFRGTDDPINGAAGGCAAGLVMGANGERVVAQSSNRYSH